MFLRDRLMSLNEDFGVFVKMIDLTNEYSVKFIINWLINLTEWKI